MILVVPPACGLVVCLGMSLSPTRTHSPEITNFDVETLSTPGQPRDGDSNGHGITDVPRSDALEEAQLLVALAATLPPGRQPGHWSPQQVM